MNDPFEHNLLLLDQLAREYQLRTHLPLTAEHIQWALFLCWEASMGYSSRSNVLKDVIDADDAIRALDGFSFEGLFR